ncbi:hypothetical protein ACFQ9J_13700 [Streptomyces sp. NPDC056529]|uniref:hypothetical protein n=1 Tax=Streptomyces sp. NPDC056529 TaxID=3345855 RepID=UPI0036B136E4
MVPRKYQGDPDDAPTMALAEFLVSCGIVAQDSVFSRFEVAVINWIPVVQNVLRMAGLRPPPRALWRSWAGHCA